jgi:hypothetical protein
MSIPRTIALAVSLLLALSACEDEPEITVEDDGREATGEVLEGSISDAMLPIDQVRSQAPLAAPEESTTGDEAETE